KRSVLPVRPILFYRLRDAKTRDGGADRVPVGGGGARAPSSAADLATRVRGGGAHRQLHGGCTRTGADPGGGELPGSFAGAASRLSAVRAAGARIAAYRYRQGVSAVAAACLRRSVRLDTWPVRRAGRSEPRDPDADQLRLALVGAEAP